MMFGDTNKRPLSGGAAAGWRRGKKSFGQARQGAPWWPGLFVCVVKHHVNFGAATSKTNLWSRIDSGRATQTAVHSSKSLRDNDDGGAGHVQRLGARHRFRRGHQRDVDARG